MMTSAAMKNAIDNMSMPAMQSMMKKMGKNPQGMSVSEMKAALKKMADNPGDLQKMSGMMSGNQQANNAIRRMAGR